MESPEDDFIDITKEAENMNLSTIKCAVSILSLTLCGAVYAEKPGGTDSTTGYLGHTSSTFDGTTGMNGLYGACQADYGQGAIVCSQVQLFESPSIGNAVINHPTGMWVRPTLIHGAREYMGGGLTAPMICPGSTSGEGMIVDTKFVVRYESCVTALPAACCRSSS